MPIKKMNGGTTVTVDEVFEIAEMHRLAEDWACRGSEFSVDSHDRYRALCADYAVDAAVLLYVLQTKLREGAPTDATKTFSAVGDLPDISTPG